MDRIINNEAIVICSVVDALNLDVSNVSELFLYVVLTADRAIRNRLDDYFRYEDFVQKESAYYQALNRKFVEFQPVFLNAMTMLLLGGKIEKKDNYSEYNLTKEGLNMLFDFQKQDAGVMEEVQNAVIHLNSLIGQIDVKTLYKDLKIVL